MTAVKRDSPRHDSTHETVHFHHDWDDDEPLSVAIVTTVAALTGRDPTDLEVLYDRVDPDALDDLFDSSGDGIGRREGRVCFPLSGCDVTVYGNGFTVVRRIE